jgi:Zn-dependent protease
LLTIAKISFVVNVFLAFFNLIPIPPLDGSWVLEHLFPRSLGPLIASVRPYAFILFLGLIYSGVLTYLLRPAIEVVAYGFLLLHACTLA